MIICVYCLRMLLFSERQNRYLHRCSHDFLDDLIVDACHAIFLTPFSRIHCGLCLSRPGAHDFVPIWRLFFSMPTVAADYQCVNLSVATVSVVGNISLYQMESGAIQQKEME